MSQVQNSTLHNFVQPALFIGAALLAGRVIEKFPGASKGGLLLSATLGSGFALASQKCAAEDESAWHSLGRVTASLALGTILAPLAAKALKGRADITMPAALCFGLVEAVIAMGLAVISPFMPYAQLLNKHTQYTNNLEEWQALPEKRRTDLVKEFYEADLPPISLKDTETDESPLNTFHDFPHMTANQLGWHVQVMTYFDDYEEEDLFALNLALHAKDLPMNWDAGITQDYVNYAQDNPECVDLLYAYFTAHPTEFARIQDDKNDPVDFGKMFDGREPIPTIAEFLEALSLENIKDFDHDKAYNWNDYFRIYLAVWNALPMEKATAFVNVFIKHNLKRISLKRIAIDFDQIWQPQLDEVNGLKKYQIQWLLRLENKQAFLAHDIDDALQQRLVQLKKTD